MDKIYNHGPRPQAVLELTQPDNARDIYLYLLLGEIRVGGGGGSRAGFRFFEKKMVALKYPDSPVNSFF